MKCLVTGGAGHIGSHVCDLLVEQGHDVCSVDILHKHGVRCLDVANLTVDMEIESDVVFHLAAQASVRKATEHPAESLNNGANLTVECLEFCKERKAKMVFVSSAIVHYTRTLPYAIEKYAGERYCEHYTSYFGISTSIIRLHCVYGSPRHKPSSGNVIPSFMDQKRTKGRITVTGDGSQVRDFIHYTDAVRAIVAAADRDGITEIGSCHGRSIREVAEMFDCPIDYVPRAGGEVDRQVCQFSDYPTTVDFETSVRDLAGTEQLESTTGCSLAASGRFFGDEG
jgi:UDP-glucose 4-epimerase